jgi:hypothetical protein
MDGGNGLLGTCCGMFGIGGRGDGDCGKGNRWIGRGVWWWLCMRVLGFG